MHTMGPWEAVEEGNEWHWRVIKGKKAIAEHCDEDNARLIAAAPEMLEALKAISNRVSFAGQDSGGWDMVKMRAAVVDEVRALIDRVEG